jgi:hypothetical protein
MSRAEVEQFLAGSAGGAHVSVWYPGLEGWKPARQFFDVTAADSGHSSLPANCNRRRHFIGRHWHGEFSLGVSYWGIVVLGNIAVAAILYGIADLVRSEGGYEPHFIFAYIAAIWLFTCALVIWQTVGVWRSANRYRERRHAAGKRAPWAVLARIAVGLGLLSSLPALLTTGWPQLHEAARMAFLGDPGIPPYAIRVMRNGTEAEISGGFKYGLTDDFRKVLRDSPGIRVVHLDSVGGRIGEAVRFHDLLQSRGLDTYVSSGCHSACTLAFAAGRRRILLNGAVLGFHAATFPGIRKEDEDREQSEQRRAFTAAGFDKGFIDTALATPNSSLWKPPADVLRAAHVITGLSDGTDFAISGLGSQVSRDRMAALIAANTPMLKSIESRYPQDYEQIVGLSYESYVSGRTEAEVTHDISAWIGALMARLRPLADDDVLVDIGLFYADKDAALAAVDPASCYRFASGDSSKITAADVTPAALLARENELTRRVVETAKPRAPAPDAVVAGIWKNLGTQLAADGVSNDQIDLLNSPAVSVDRYGAYCTAFVTLYREIARLPPGDAAILMRTMLGGK